MKKHLSLNDFKDDGTGFKYEIKTGETVTLHLDAETASVLKEHERLKAENEAKNQRIRELEEKAFSLVNQITKKLPTVAIPDDEGLYFAIHDLKQLLNQKP